MGASLTIDEYSWYLERKKTPVSLPPPPSSPKGMSKVIIFDDSDPAIVYGGNWTIESTGMVMTNEYNSTVHVSNSQDNTLTFKFEGTSLSVWGTLDRPNVIGPPDATFSVDGSPPVEFNTTFVVKPKYPLNTRTHVQLYQTPLLPNGPHTFTMNVNPIPAFYLDFLTVNVTSSSVAETFIVDDLDPRIKYNGHQFNVESDDAYMSTAHKIVPDNNGNATFSFYGESIQVYGMAALLGPTRIGYIIDGLQKDAYLTSRSQYHTILIHEEELSADKEHTIVIPMSLSSSSWHLDYIVYGTIRPNNGPATAPQSPDQSPNTGAIVGGVIGGVLLAAFIALGCMWLRRRRQKQKSTAPEVVFTSRSSADTRSIRSVRSTSGTTSGIGTSQTGLSTPSGILKHGLSSSAAAEKLRIRISETASTSRVSVGSSAGVARSSLKRDPPRTEMKWIPSI